MPRINANRDLLIKIAETIKKIEISPVDPGGTGYILTEVIPQQSIDCTVNTGGTTYAGEIRDEISSIVSGAHYLVTYDEYEYLCDGYTAESNAYNLGDNGIVTNISVTYLNYPFFISNVAGGNYLQVRGSGTHTLKVEQLEFTVTDEDT